MAKGKKSIGASKRGGDARSQMVGKEGLFVGRSLSASGEETRGDWKGRRKEGGEGYVQKCQGTLSTRVITVVSFTKGKKKKKKEKKE